MSPAPCTSSTLDHALDLHRRGFAVIPVPHRQKAPKLAGWQTLRLSEADLAGHFNGSPGNVGILLGEPSGGLIDVDLDHPRALALADALLPPTGAIFGRGERPRSHRLYRVAGPIGTERHRLRAGGTIIELRGAGAQTIAPGSTHPSGDAVRWDEAGEPAAVDAEALQRAVRAIAGAVRAAEGEGEPEPPPASPTLQRASERPRRAPAGAEVDIAERERRCRLYLAKCPDSIEGQGGDGALFRAAAECVRFDLDDRAAMAVLRWYNAEKASPAWPERRLGYKLAEACRVVAGERGSRLGGGDIPRPPRNPEPAPEDEAGWLPPVPLLSSGTAPEFPILEAFPPSLDAMRDFAVAVADSAQVAVDLPAMLALPVVAAAIGQKAELRLTPDWREPPPIWTLCLLEPANRKSGVFRELLRPVTEWERDEGERLRPLIAQQAEERRIADKRLGNLRERAAKADGEEAIRLQAEAVELAEQLDAGDPIVAPRLFTTEATAEALVGLMAEQRGRFLLAAAEADAFDTLLGRYSKGVPNFAPLLAGHAGDTLRSDRRGRGSDFIERPTLSLAMTVQPEAVIDLWGHRQARGRGLIARFLPCMPPSKIGRRVIRPEPIPDDLRAWWGRCIRHLLDLPIPDEPCYVGLHPEADRLFEAFQTDVERMLGPDGSLGDRQAWGGKLCGAVARIALAIHALEAWAAPCRVPTTGERVSPGAMEAALAWAPYLIESERRVAAMVGIDPDAKLALRLLRWLASTGLAEFTRRDAFTRARGADAKTVEAIDAPLALLAAHGYVRTIDAEKPRGRGRPPSDRFEVNPVWDRAVPEA